MVEEFVVPEDFTIRIRIKRSEQEDLLIEENGLDLKFDIGMALRNAPPNDARWPMLAAYLTHRWKEQLGDLIISKDTALGIWATCLKKSEELKKNSSSLPNSLPPSQA